MEKTRMEEKIAKIKRENNFIISDYVYLLDVDVKVEVLKSIDLLSLSILMRNLYSKDYSSILWATGEFGNFNTEKFKQTIGARKRMKSLLEFISKVNIEIRNTLEDNYVQLLTRNVLDIVKSTGKDELMHDSNLWEIDTPIIEFISFFEPLEDIDSDSIFWEYVDANNKKLNDILLTKTILEPSGDTNFSYYEKTVFNPIIDIEEEKNLFSQMLELFFDNLLEILKGSYKTTTQLLKKSGISEEEIFDEEIIKFVQRDFEKEINDKIYYTMQSKNNELLRILMDSLNFGDLYLLRQKIERDEKANEISFTTELINQKPDNYLHVAKFKVDDFDFEVKVDEVNDDSPEIQLQRDFEKFKKIKNALVKLMKD